MSIVKSFSVDVGDMFYIKHNTDNFTVIDCCINDYNSNKILNEILVQSKDKNIQRFISTHPDNDHIKGLTKFYDQVGINNFYCVANNAIKEDKTEDFQTYCSLRDNKKVAYNVYQGCKRKWMNESSQERDGAGINFVWPVLKNEEHLNALFQVENGKGYNNISPIFTYGIKNSATFMWLGDIEHDFIEKIEHCIDWYPVDVLFAPHHGRDSGKIPQNILKKINPQLIVIGEAPSEYLNYYSGYNTIKQNSAKDIVFECLYGTVNIYISADHYYHDTSFLHKENDIDVDLGNYIGSFKTEIDN